MAQLRCEHCGGALRLDVPRAEYVCEDEPVRHRFTRSLAEEQWVHAAVTRADADNAAWSARLELADVYEQLAAMCLEAGETERAREWTQRRAEVVGKMDAAAADEQTRPAIMLAFYSQAQLAESAGDRLGSLRFYESMLGIANTLRDETGENAQRDRAVSVALNGVGRMLRALGKTEEASSFFARDVALLMAARERDPADVEIASELASGYFNLYLTASSREEEQRCLRSAVAVVDDLRPGNAVPERAWQVRRRALEELTRLEQAPGEQGTAAADSQAQKVESEAGSAEVRSWLVEQVEVELRRRGK